MADPQRQTIIVRYTSIGDGARAAVAALARTAASQAAVDTGCTEASVEIRPATAASEEPTSV